MNDSLINALKLKQRHTINLKWLAQKDDYIKFFEKKKKKKRNF